MFIDRTYFNQNSVASLPDSDVVNSLLSNQSFIDRCEKEILMKLLGRTLYNDLIANKDTTDTSNKWYKFIHGSTFTVDDITLTWVGIVNAEKRSFLANYVACEVLKQLEFTLSDTGVSRQTAQNADKVGMMPRYADVWNDMVKMYGDCGIYAESAYNYLLMTDDVFDGWVFTELTELSSNGI